MTTSVILYSIMLAVFFGYILFIVAKYGIQKSVSQSFYVLPKNINFLFTLFCWGFVLPAMILSENGLMFFGGAGIGFVGAAAAYKGNKMANSVHMIGAYVGILLSQLSIFFNFNLPYVNIAFFSLILLIFLISRLIKMKTLIWWIEMVAFLAIVYAIGVAKVF